MFKMSTHVRESPLSFRKHPYAFCTLFLYNLAAKYLLALFVLSAFT